MIRFELELKRNQFKNFFIGLVFLGMQACASSELAQKLSNSFDTSLGTDGTTNLIDKKNSIAGEFRVDSPQTSQERTNSNENKINKVDISQGRQVITKPFKKQPYKTKAKEVFFSPQPYRIIIRLSGANPSAPAETVTKALRNAGILFEVERIERFEKGSSKLMNPDKR